VAKYGQKTIVMAMVPHLHLAFQFRELQYIYIFQHSMQFDLALMHQLII